MFVAVEAPDHPILYARIQRRSDPDAGVVSVTLPPIILRASEILGLAIEAIDGVALARAASNEDQAVENALVRLRAHGIRTLVLLNPHWPRDAALGMLGRTLSSAGIDALLIVHPGWQRWVTLDDWVGVTWDWERFTTEVPLRANSDPGGDADRHQRVALPMPVPASFQPVRLTPLDDAEAAALLVALRRRLAGDAEPTTVARAVRQVLRHLDLTDRHSRQVLAAVLDEAGYLLLEAHDAQEKTWRDLRRVPDVAAAAALALLAHGLDGRDVARLRLVDVAPDGSAVATRHRLVAITPAARPYLVAARLSCRDPEHLLYREARPVNRSNVYTMATEALEALGLVVEPRDIERSLSPSGRWLVARGLLLRRVRQPTRPPASGGLRRCRHHLPNVIPAGTGDVLHTRRCCAAVEPDEVRPWASYRVWLAETGDGVERYRIERDGESAGSAWRVSVPLGPVWVETQSAHPPGLPTIRDAVRASQTEAPPRRLGRQ